MKNDPHIDDLIERYLSGEASPADLDALAQAAAEGPALAGRIHLQAQVDEDIREFYRRVPATADERDAIPGAARSVGWRRWIPLAAAVVLAAAGVWWGLTNSERPSTSLRAGGTGMAVARVVESVQCSVFSVQEDGRTGSLRALNVGGGVQAGMRIETAGNGAAKLEYVDGRTTVQLGKNSKFEIRNPQLAHLDTGRIALTVAKQAHARPFVVLTPQARVEVKGTRFVLGVDAKATRLDVLEGLVGIERLSDGKIVDVAAGQYAVAAEGVELVARALPAGGVIAGAGTPANPQPRTHLYGRILFEDEFETLENWEIVMRKADGTWEIAPPEIAKYVSIRGRDSDILLKNKGDAVKSAVFINTNRKAEGIQNVTLCIRSKFRIDADRFVIEADTIMFDSGLGPGSELVTCGIETEEETQMAAAGRSVIPAGWMRHAYEFVPSPADGPDTYIRRHFSTNIPWPGQNIQPNRSLNWFGEWRARVAGGRRILLGSRNASLFFHRVAVREILETDVAESAVR